MFQFIGKGLVAFVAAILTLIPQVRSMEAYVRDQIAPSIVYVPGALISYPFKAKTSDEVKAVTAKAGGFLKGICHPTDNYEQIKGAGIEWNRADIPFPFDEEGNLRQSYIDWKERMRRFAENGIKIMAVTPYPKTYIEYGIDPRLPENEERVREIARFFITDLEGLIGAVQVSNELGIPRFALPLTLEECVRFLGVNLEAMYPIRGDVIIGYNTAGPQADQHMLMKPYLDCCDYVGIDIYIGCFFGFGNWLFVFDLMLDYIWSYTGKPIILAEFGYISGGAPKTEAEKQAILEQYGASSEEEARANIEDFVARLPERLRSRVYSDASGDWGDYLFLSDMKLHLYQEMPANVVIRDFPHTPEGQADFYSTMLRRLAKKKYLVGAFIYCYADSGACYVCGQSDCPIETRWGLTDMDGREKPSYYAVQSVWGK